MFGMSALFGDLPGVLSAVRADEEMADELYDKLASYYEEDPNVTVIVDRRKQERESA